MHEKRFIRIEEKLEFLEHSVESLSGAVSDLHDRLKAVEKAVTLRCSSIEERLGQLEEKPSTDDPPPHWGRARPDSTA